MAYRQACGKCALPLSGMDEHIVCDGCSKQYHLICMNMNPYQLRVCVEFNNVLWLCDNCLASFRKQRSMSKNDVTVRDHDQNASNIERTVSQLQSEFATMKQCFAELKQSFNGGQNTNDNTVDVPSTSTPQGNSCRGRSFSLHSNDTAHLQRGSNAEISTGSRKFWLFFTKVAKHVSTDAIGEMVKHSLETNDKPEVMRLVPRWSNLENLRYVSFKVGIDWKHRGKAIMESTWPTGLLFREFEHRESCWEP